MLSATARQLVRWLNQLGKISDDEGALTRTFLSPAMRRANGCVAQWMHDAGLDVREDAVGNLIGRLEPTPRAGGQGAVPRALLLGSHLDTVRNAGRFDGALGVLLPIAALHELQVRGVSLPFAVEVLGFSEEEGVRFSSAYLGSKGYSGQLRASDLTLKDSSGFTVREALVPRETRGFRLPEAAHRSSDLVGYVEVHIEQGPVLEQENLAVGVVSGISGQTRGRFRFTGKAGHAGTTPMSMRRDALAGAAELVLFIEQRALAQPPLVATVGTISARPGAPNVIPAEASISLDLRHPQNADRARALQEIVAAARSLARRRGLRVKWQLTQENDAVACSPTLVDLLDSSVRAVQSRSATLVSGAGHDAVIMSAVTPVAMLFVRCREGLSHHPDEYASPADITVALQVMVDFIERLARTPDLVHTARSIRRAKSRRPHKLPSHE